MAGFYHVGQRDLLDGYGVKYADVAPKLWNSLSPEMALRTRGHLPHVGFQ